MKNTGKLATLSPAEQARALAQIRSSPIFVCVDESTRRCLLDAEVMEAAVDDRLMKIGEVTQCFWILLDGELRVEYIGPDGVQRAAGSRQGCNTFGEISLLAGSPTRFECVVEKPSRLLRLDLEAFWRLLASCPEVRKGIVGSMAHRIESMQAMTLQQEKLASLGTMAAGLMHELNNPGSAARRATAQLRENLRRLQEISLRSCRMDLHPQELNCMADLQEYILQPHKLEGLSSLDQSDAEEALAHWLDQAGIQDSWKLAPPLVSIGLTAGMLECTRTSFRPEALSGALQWLEALVSSMQQLATIEESVTRVSDLVMAVKRYSYAEKTGSQSIDVHESLQSTLLILGHKFRQKAIEVTRDFSPDLPLLQVQAGGLHQVWTNLLDNAVDAVPQQGHIVLRTWMEGSEVCVSISDDGPGISAEDQLHLFEPFFTSKPAGVGTGLGLGIAKKIVTSHFGGEIRFTSQPGHTEFIVCLPQNQAVAKA
ncbi:MAG TPA: ATP-binding protein [Acidobacteriaceae bacterium]|nr:ATP-binding protein [Acidobacteriaceae bacterium]